MILIEIEHSMVTAELLGFDDYIPPFATARCQDILKGVNYRSGQLEFEMKPDNNWYSPPLNSYCTIFFTFY